MRTKPGLMSAMILSCAFGAWSLALAETATATIEVPAAAASSAVSPEKPIDRISLRNLKNMRDPFKRMAPDSSDVLDEKPRSELETVPVSEFKMVGVLTGPYKTRALVRAPSGNVYPVTDGTRMGVQNGYVRKVLRDRIIVNEIVQDVLGEKELVTSELKLNAKGAEKGVSSVSAIVTPLSVSNASKGKEGQDHDIAEVTPSLKNEGIKQASAAGDSAAHGSASGGNPFNLSVPAPVALPKPGLINGATSNASQQTAGSR